MGDRTCGLSYDVIGTGHDVIHGESLPGEIFNE